MSISGHSTALPAGRPSGSWLTAGLIGGIALLAFAGVGAVLRPLFPLLSLLLASYFLLTGRREALVELCLWLFMVTPGIRRVVDASAGWDVVNILMLAPYTASALCVLPAMQGLFGRRFAYSMPFAVLFACVLYAVLLAVVDGRVFAGLYDSLRWTVPPCLGLMIALEPERRQAYRDVATRTLSIGVSAMAAYGVFQYLVVPPWDAFWMNNVEMNSIGSPEPFLVRVFSTMNSPGSFATFALCALLMVLPSQRLMRWPALTLGAAAILLTVVRAAWLGTTLGFLFTLVAGRSWRVRGSILAAFLFIGLALPIVAEIPQAATMINDRLDTLTSLSGDASAVDRSNAYADFFNNRLGRNPFGLGLAINGTYSSYLDQGESAVIDGAVIEIGTAMGVIGGCLYLLAVAVLVGVSIRAGLGAADGFTTGCAAAVFAGATLLTSGTTTVGESGIIYWTAIGFCLAAAQERPAVSRPRSAAARPRPAPPATRPGPA